MDELELRVHSTILPTGTVVLLPSIKHVPMRVQG